MFNDWTKRAIVVRLRTLEETRDLALLVFGKEFKNVALYSFALVLPIFLVDFLFFLGFWTLSAEHNAPIKPNEPENLALFLIFAYLLIRLEGAFAGSITTQFLGLWFFRRGEKISPKEVFSAWFRRLPQLLYFLVFTRLIRTRAFYAEVILLEQTPFFKTKNKIKTSARVRAVNRGELSNASLTTGFFWFCGAFSGYFVLDRVGSLFIDEEKLWFFALNLVVFPLFLFSAQIFLTVYHFLRYINFRVEREGWDVDLAFKAERAKLYPDVDFWKSEAGERIERRALRALSFDRENSGETPVDPPESPLPIAPSVDAVPPSETEAPR